MRTHNIHLHVKENQKDIPIKPPDLTLTDSNYPCLELIFMVPKVFKPLKFDCTYKTEFLICEKKVCNKQIINTASDQVTVTVQ